MILNEYETIYVTRPDLTEDLMSRINTRYSGVIAENGGTILVTEDWGMRKLAYPINKHQRGHFIYLNYVAPATLVHELERTLRIEDSLLRYLTVKLGDDINPETSRQMAEERRRIRDERMRAQKAEEEAEARYRAEAEEEEEEAD